MNRTDSSRGKRYFLKTQPILMHMGRCPLDPREGQRPFEPVNGFVLRGGPTSTYQRPCRPSPENKPN
jgi:hypothetical protein